MRGCSEQPRLVIMLGSERENLVSSPSRRLKQAICMHKTKETLNLLSNCLFLSLLHSRLSLFASLSPLSDYSLRVSERERARERQSLLLSCLLYSSKPYAEIYDNVFLALSTGRTLVRSFSLGTKVSGWVPE